MVADEDDLFVSYTPSPPVNGVSGAFDIAEYVESTGMTNDPLISGGGGVAGIAVDGDDLFLANFDGLVSEYTTSGTQLSNSLIPGLDVPSALAVGGNDLYVVDEGNGTIGEYTTSGGPINTNLVSGLSGNIFSVAVVVPEPATLALITLSGAGLLLRRRNHTKSSI